MPEPLKPSDAIEYFAYDPAEKQLRITFPNGMRYCYYGVPLEVAEDMAQAPSWGQFFLTEIKGKYRYLLMSRRKHGTM